MKILYSCNKAAVQYLRESDVLFIKYLLLIKTEGLVLFLLEKMCVVCVYQHIFLLQNDLLYSLTCFTLRVLHPHMYIRMNRRDERGRLNPEVWDRQGMYHAIWNKKYLQHCSRNIIWKKDSVFLVMTLCSIICNYQCFRTCSLHLQGRRWRHHVVSGQQCVGGTCCPHLQIWRWTQQGPLKCR